LARQPELSASFKIPEEMAAGEIVDEAKVFSQTIRAKDSRVGEIPSLGFSYFDPERGEYRTARTEPIPLEVSGTRVLTLSDAEGAGPGGAVQSELEDAQGGIAHNYEDADALRDRRGLLSRLGSPLWALALGAPPALYFGLLALVTLRRRRAEDPATIAARSALEELAALSPNSDAAFAGALLEKLRAYLRLRLGLPPGALTFADVKGPLEGQGASRETLDRLRHVFTTCEAARYTGGALTGATPAELHAQALEACRSLEQRSGGKR